MFISCGWLGITNRDKRAMYHLQFQEGGTYSALNQKSIESDPIDLT